jgi:hypothetical protein
MLGGSIKSDSRLGAQRIRKTNRYAERSDQKEFERTFGASHRKDSSHLCTVEVKALKTTESALEID